MLNLGVLNEKRCKKAFQMRTCVNKCNKKRKDLKRRFK